MLNISRSAVGEWEHGKNKPTAGMLEYLAEILNTDVNYIFGTETDKEILFKQGLKELNLDKYKALSEADKKFIAEQFNALIDRLEKK